MSTGEDGVPGPSGQESVTQCIARVDQSLLLCHTL